MFEMEMYLVPTYVVLLLIVFAALLFRQPRRLSQRIIVIVLLLMLPLLPYIMVKYRTLRYGSELAQAVRQESSSEPGHICMYKVLEMAPTRAVVYIVVGDHGDYGGFTVPVVRHGNKWKTSYRQWVLIWADTGNADDNVFPPYPTNGAYYDRCKKVL